MYKKIILNNDAQLEVANIANGVYAPLKGFLARDDLRSVLSEMRLADGSPWSIPIVLDIDRRDYSRLKNESIVELIDEDGNLLALLKGVEAYAYDKDDFARNVFGTLDRKHPGVKEVFAMGDYLLGGELQMLVNLKNKPHEYTTVECRQVFKERGWKKIVAFQTRNVPHLGHEFLQLQALAQVDGLLIHPVLGKKKTGDFRDEVIMESYRILMKNHYPQDKCLLVALSLRMRYAGPREALFHALIRRNFGCTHFIVGRDHAGVADYYEPFAAQEIFENFSSRELGIEILKFEEVVFDKNKGEYCFKSACPVEDRTLFSGTALRNSIVERNHRAKHLVRPEVYDYLLEQDTSPFVE